MTHHACIFVFLSYSKYSRRNGQLAAGWLAGPPAGGVTSGAAKQQTDWLGGCDGTVGRADGRQAAAWAGGLAAGERPVGD